MDFDTKVRGKTQLLEWKNLVKKDPVAAEDTTPQVIKDTLQYDDAVVIAHPKDLVTKEYVDAVNGSGLGIRTVARLPITTTGQQDYSLPSDPIHSSLLDVIVNGIVLDEGVSLDYTVTTSPYGTVLHLNTTSIELTDKIVVKYW